MKAVCVYCGSATGRRSEYAAAADALGEALVARNLTLVYGGADKGLMGRIANTVKAAGGRVKGVMPQALVDKEIAHRGLDELHVVASMHERKALMAELSDAFVALPGGIGTLEELIETLTWAQLGLHAKPCGLLNINGYYDELLAFLERSEREGFLRTTHRDMLLVEAEPAGLLRRFEDYRAPSVAKWRD